MKFTRNRISYPLLSLLIWLGTAGMIFSQEGNPLQISANGKGTIKIGREQFVVNSVVVKLREDGKAEIILVSEITFFLQGTWAKKENTPTEIDLTITGGTSGGGATGTGKLRLREDAKSLSGLTLEGSSNTRKRLVKVNFVAQ